MLAGDGHYLFVYHGGSVPQTEEGGRAVTAAWLDWFAALGDRVVDGGNAVGPVKTVAGAGVVTKGRRSRLSDPHAPGLGRGGPRSMT